MGMNPVLVARRVSGRVKGPGPDIVTFTTVMARAVAVLPRNNKAAILEPAHRWPLLTARGIGVDPKLCPNNRTTGIVALAAYVGARTAIVTTAVIPGHHEAAILE